MKKQLDVGLQAAFVFGLYLALLSSFLTGKFYLKCKIQIILKTIKSR